MAMRPDPTFYPSPKLAMEGPPEEFAYTALLSGDSSKPDALAVIDVKRGSPTYSKVVHTVTMPYKGDEFHHFGWNACSSALSPLTGHAFLERRYLIVPGIRSSRLYVVDTKPHPTEAKIHKIIEPEEIFKKTGYSRPHTVHCGPEGIYVSTLGGAGKDGTEGAPGVFIMDCETFEVLGRWEIDRGPQKLHYDFWWNLPRDYMVSSEWDSRRNSRMGSLRRTCSRTNTATISTSGICAPGAMCRRSISARIIRWRSKSARPMIRCANTAFWVS
jgi:methanethiol oxidase